ncbi:MAG: alpha/beta hydrolase [Sphingomonadales bacterium]|nr:alpha/beta hydrolase [Sphingomonadales bacterium]
MGSYSIKDGVVDLGKISLPLPDTISAEARAYLAFDPNQGAADGDGPPPPMWTARDALAPMFQWLNDQAKEAYPVTIEEIEIAGVRCHLIKPEGKPVAPDRVLINLHGGGFVLGSGSLVEAIPIAHETGSAVIAIDYRLAPEHPFPAAVDDIVAVYRVVLEHHPATEIGLYGTSAGGFLTAMTVMRLKKEGLPLPACCGVFTAGGDVTTLGDTFNLFTLSGFYGHIGHKLDDPDCERAVFLGDADPDDPLVAPIKGDLSDFPPTLLISGTRDAVLSATVLFHRALRRAGREADLHVFEAMPHGFWFSVAIPESREAIDVMSRFFERHLCR